MSSVPDAPEEAFDQGGAKRATGSLHSGSCIDPPAKLFGERAAVLSTQKCREDYCEEEERQKPPLVSGGTQIRQCSTD
jgi:hypothetical protein